MLESVCLLGEASLPMRNLMRGTLREAGFEVLQAESAAALATQIHHPRLLSASTLLLVLTAHWAFQCAVPISVAATLRDRMNLSLVRVVLLYEWGTPGLLAQAELHYCRIVGMLEKPFEMRALEAIARSSGAAIA